MEKRNLSIREVKETQGIPPPFKHRHVSVFTWPLLPSYHIPLWSHPWVPGNTFKSGWCFPQNDVMLSPQWHIFLQQMSDAILESLGRTCPSTVVCLWAMNTGNFQTIRNVLFFPLGGFCFNSQTCVPAHGCAGRAGHLPPQQAAAVHDLYTQVMHAELPRQAETM